jgi:hypothetical protein
MARLPILAGRGRGHTAKFRLGRNRHAGRCHVVMATVRVRPATAQSL